MADNDVATKAPESDAQENLKDVEEAEGISGIPGDTKPDQGSASMGEHCVTDRPTTGETPTGEITKYNDIEVYVTKPADYPHSPSKLLLLLTGGTGVHSTNNQLQADNFAQEGFLVVMPDQFSADPAPSTTTTQQAAESNPSIIEQVKLGVASVAKSFTIDMWLARHTPEKVLPILYKVITSVKEEFADAVAYGGGIYAVGYCFGARYVLLLGSETGGSEFTVPAASTAKEEGGEEREAEEGTGVKNGPFIKAGSIAHGTQASKDEVAGVKVPVQIVAVENDPLFPDEEREAGVEKLKESGLEHAVEVYSDVPHGFAVVGEYEDASIKEKQGKAFKSMSEWLKGH